MARPKCTTTGKTKFPSKLECDLAVLDIQINISYHRKQKFREEPRRSYECKYCRQWHMTSLSLESLDLQSLTA